MVREFPAAMPWEGTKEKKQKQGTSDARLVYVMHMHKPDYKRMKMLLSYAKGEDVWHKLCGNVVFTIVISTREAYKK